MTDRTHPDSGRIITSGDILLHDAETALMYEELRAAIDDGNESMTHADALAEIAAIRAENVELRAQLASIGAGGVSGPLMGRASLAANAGSEPVARLLHWHGPSHYPVPHGGIAARTFAEFPKEEAEKPDAYWRNGAPLYTKADPPAGSESRALQALRYYRDECSGAEPSISVFHQMMEEALSAHPSSPEGMVMVPKEPTKAMLLAGSADLRLGDCIGTLTRAAECYRAMLEAAPPTTSAGSRKGE